MGQTIKVQRSVSSALLTASISGLYVILEAAFTIALLGVLLYNYLYNQSCCDFETRSGQGVQHYVI